MDNPFILPFHNPDISAIHDDQQFDNQLQGLLNQSNSRYTAAETLVTTLNNQQAYHSIRVYIVNILQSWGMNIGVLPFSKQNQITLKCIRQLVSQKQKDNAYKLKLKQQMSAINFEKEKYESLLKQARNTISQKDKLLGKLENQSMELKKKVKILQNQSKKEKLDDQKMIFMLKSKNQQIMHQIKKKESEVNKIKQQMKKNVMTKSNVSSKTQSPMHSNNQSVKNSFQLIERVQKGWNAAKSDKNKKNITERVSNQSLNDHFEQEKFNFMIDKYEKQKKAYSNENSELRNNIFQIRQILVKFAEWINIELFGESQQSTTSFLRNKFICNHNLMFSQDALSNDLISVINEAKQGIQQLQSRLQQQMGHFQQKSQSSPSKGVKHIIYNQSQKLIPIQQQKLFKKKSISIRQPKQISKSSNSPLNAKSQKQINLIANLQIKQQKEVKQLKTKAQQQNKIYQKWKKNNTEKNKETTNSNLLKKKAEVKRQVKFIGESMPSQIKKSEGQKFLNELQLSAFQHDILSEVYEPQQDDHENSIVSHISTSQLIREAEKGKYDRWDVLFHADNNE